MAGLVRGRETPDKRLVLGFDAGCMTCSELARRIEEQVGDKLEIRSLRDPQVEEWRRRALGDDAPWAPTLIEVKGAAVGAWTGRRMGLALSRALGPVATWQVLQVLGEIGAVSEAEEPLMARAVTGLTRRRFLKGVAGAALAVSIVPGALAFSSTTAEAAKHKGRGLKDATPAQRKEALDIVRHSNQYQNLEKDLKRKAGRHGATYDFDKAQVKVTHNGYFATVTLGAIVEEKIVSTAAFRVNYSKKTATLFGGAHYTPNARGQTRGEIKATPHVNDHSSPTYPYFIMGVHREGQTVKGDYIKTAADEKKSLNDFEKEMERYKNQQRPAASGQVAPQQSTATAAPQYYSDAYVQCTRDLQAEADSEDSACSNATYVLDGISFGLGGLAIPTAGATALPALFVGGVSLLIGGGCIAQHEGRPDPYQECQGL